MLSKTLACQFIRVDARQEETLRVRGVFVPMSTATEFLKLRAVGGRDAGAQGWCALYGTRMHVAISEA